MDLENVQLYDQIQVFKTAHGSLLPLVRLPPPVPVETEVPPASLVDGAKTTRLGYQRYRSTNLEQKTERLDGVHVPCIVSNAKRRKCVFQSKIKTRYECETCQYHYA